MDNLKSKLREAKRLEETTGQRYYVTWSVLDKNYLVTARMPFVGEWYDSDEIQHGQGIPH